MTISQIIYDRLAREGPKGIYLRDDDRARLDAQINGLILRIQQCDDLSAADALLIELGELQELLATLLFKYHLALSPKQETLVRKYDRSDNRDERDRVFRAIRSGQFP